MDGNGSEVARIRRQIEQECEAAKRGLHGTAITASHTFINRRYENIESIKKS